MHQQYERCVLLYSLQGEDAIEPNQRCILNVLKESLEDHPGDIRTHNEVRYKLIIDPSEDDSLLRHLFKFGVLQKDKTYTYVCSDLVSDSEIDKVSGRFLILDWVSVLFFFPLDQYHCCYLSVSHPRPYSYLGPN